MFVDISIESSFWVEQHFDCLIYPIRYIYLNGKLNMYIYIFKYTMALGIYIKTNTPSASCIYIYIYKGSASAHEAELPEVNIQETELHSCTPLVSWP